MKYTIKVPVEDDNGKMTSLSIEISKEEHARIESTRLTANFPVNTCADRIMTMLRLRHNDSFSDNTRELIKKIICEEATR